MIEVSRWSEKGAESYRLCSVRESATHGNFEWTVHWPGQKIQDPLALDLLEIAKGVHMADRMFRRSLMLGQRERQIVVRVPVAQPALWKKMASHLEALVGFASTDVWKLEFDLARHGRTEKRKKTDEFSASTVALFSGGLDSLCGAAYLARLKGARPVFVSHSPPGRENNARLIQGVWKSHHDETFPVERCITFRLQLHERDAKGLRNMFQESTRRTRPFFFLALACAVALDRQIPAVQMSENGALGMSLPLHSDSYGAQCTRQAHTRLLHGFAELLNCLAPRPGGWNVSNPFEQMTKGEACMLLQKASPLAKAAISCEYVGRQAAFLRNWISKHPGAAAQIGQGPQCGLCTPCLVRRAALYRAGIADPDKLYFFNARRVLRGKEKIPGSYLSGKKRARIPLYEAAVPQVYFMRRFCEAIHNMTELDFVLQYFSELRFLVNSGNETTQEIRKCRHLIKKLGREMLRFLDSKPR
jgi:hypothetical protein